MCLFYSSSKPEHPPRPTRPPPPTPDTLPLKIKGDLVPSVSLRLCCDPHQTPLLEQQPTHSSQEAFPNSGLAPARSCTLGVWQPSSCSTICEHRLGPTHAGSPPPPRPRSPLHPHACWHLDHVPRMDNEPESSLQKSWAGSAQREAAFSSQPGI